MNSIIELIVSGNTSGATVAGGTVDLYGNESINLIFSIKNIRDIAATSASYSQSFQIPGTKNNNQIFQNLFLIGADGEFDPRKKASCVLIVDSQQLISGTFQITDINVTDRDIPVYSVTIFGAAKSFNSAIKGKYLTDYDWSELNHVLSVAKIANSWSANSSLGYYYSIKDYGYDYTLDSVKGKVVGSGVNAQYRPGIPVGNMFPDVYNKYIVDKIFSAEGFSYSSTLLTSTTFAETVIPYSNDMNSIMGSDFLSARTFVATSTALSSTTTLASAHSSQFTSIPYNYEFEYRLRADTILSGSAVYSGYSQHLSGDSYTFDQPELSQFGFGVNFKFNTTGTFGRGQIGARFYRSNYAGGLYPFYTNAQLISPDEAGPGYFECTTPLASESVFTLTDEKFVPFAAGEKVWVSLFWILEAGWVAASPTFVPFEITSGGMFWKHIPSSQRTSGQIVNMNNVIPEKVLVTDYLKSIFNMFNCYIEPHNTIPNQFYIESFEEFYAQGTQRDWSDKLDRSQKVEEKLISEELAKQYTFTYKEDKDFLNENYKNSQKRIYGDLTYNIENEFTTNEETISVIFSPTPVDNIIGSSNFIVPRIGKYDSNGRFGKTNFNMRFLRKNPSLTRLPTGEYFRFTGSTTYASYPYAGHLNHPFTGTTDYNFGSVPYVYYPWPLMTSNAITENNLVNTYWKKWLDEVSDKEAKLITAYFKLSPTDIATFRFADNVFVEGLTSEGGHTYRVNAIEYSPTSGKPAKVELLKVLTKYVSKIPSKKIINIFDKYNMGVAIGVSSNYKPNVITVGVGSISDSDNIISVGNGNYVGPGTDGTLVVGDKNIVGRLNTGTTIFGTTNTIDSGVNGSTVIGDYNNILSGSTNAYVKGSFNTILYAQQVHVDGSGNTINSTYNTGITFNTKITGNFNNTVGSSSGLTIAGDYNTASTQTVDTKIIGIGNVLSAGTNTISITGNYNQLAGTHTGVTVFGNGNLVNANVSYATINGFNNVIPAGLTNTTILNLNNYTATTSDMTHVPGLTINNNLVLGPLSHILQGNGTASGTLANAFNSGGTSTGNYSNSFGLSASTSRSGEVAIASRGGYGQRGIVVAQSATTGTQSAELFLSYANERFTIPTGESYAVRLNCVATDNSNQNSITYEGRGLIKNVAGTTSLSNPILMSVLAYDSPISATSFTVTADDTNDSLKMLASGQTSTTLNWVCSIDYTKVNKTVF
jgi:hypothetical protein